MSQTREKILEAARDLYVEQGPRALSMRKIAARVGVSAPAIYRHFEGKEALVVEVCREGFELFSSYLMRGLRGADPRERLAMTGRGYLAFALDHPRYYRVMFMSPHPDFDELVSASEAALSPTFQFLVDRVSECQRDGLLDSASEPRQLARSIWAHSHGLVALWLDGHFQDSIPDEQALRDFHEDYQRQLIEGMAPRPEG